MQFHLFLSENMKLFTFFLCQRIDRFSSNVDENGAVYGQKQLKHFFDVLQRGMQFFITLIRRRIIKN